MHRRGTQPAPPGLEDDPYLHRWLVRRGLRKRVTCQWMGQLGNQLYQVAATISHAQRIGGFAFIPDWAYRRVFDCRIPTGYSTEGMDLFEESRFDYAPPPPRGDLALRGLFQSFSLFEEDLVRRTIRFHPDIVRYARHRYGDIFRQHTSSLHVRRGDTLSPDNWMRDLPFDFYERAMALLPETELFVIFSDDIVWCRKHFTGPRFRFMEGEENFVDMCSMSLCQNHIIPNSTFSWWGAWLNPNPRKKVIAPLTWYKSSRPGNEIPHRFPERWIIID